MLSWVALGPLNAGIMLPALGLWIEASSWAGVRSFPMVERSGPVVAAASVKSLVLWQPAHPSDLNWSLPFFGSAFAAAGLAADLAGFFGGAARAAVRSGIESALAARI